MAAAVYVKTESGDNYVFAFDGTPSPKEIIKQLKDRMDEEYDYICDCKYDATYDLKLKLKTEFLN
jgi:hypothetical protein